MKQAKNVLEVRGKSLKNRDFTALYAKIFDLHVSKKL